MEQYFGIKKENDILYLNNNDLNHIKNVRRRKENDEVIICFDNKKYLCSLSKNLISGRILGEIKVQKEMSPIIAYIPILQEEKMSFILMKGTEIGVSKFIPVDFEYSKFKLKDEVLKKKYVRWKKIVKNAAEQCNRNDIPEVENAIKVENIKSINGVNIVCSLDINNVKDLNEVLTSKNACDTISLVFGPEGGISINEEKIIEKNGFIKTSLCKNILRSETVIIYLVSIINYLREW